jgi:DNA-binding winged helix-turn-helix (wHTH) protein
VAEGHVVAAELAAEMQEIQVRAWVASASIRFGPFQFFLYRMELFRNGKPVRLESQPLSILSILARQPGIVVSREVLCQELWGQSFVDFDNCLNHAVSKLRSALRDDASEPLFIQTVRGKGYRLAGVVIPDWRGSPWLSRPAGRQSSKPHE